jgi:tetratricopeptide (TPR) repeat protein
MFGLGLLLAVMVGCNPHPTSSQLSSVGKGKSYQTLVGIDSLMWEQPDSALKVMMQFAASSEADSLNAFEGHYCQLLIAELLFKNNYDQTNRKALQQAMVYFDSLVRLAPPLKGGRGDSKHTLSPNNNLIFLAARAHYINGAAYFEHDSLIEACTEYLHTLRTMESQFTENELVGKKASFMALTYNRLIDLFSAQFMQEPAIYCGKQGLVYNRIAPTSPYGVPNVLYRIGKQFDKLKIADSAAYYYDLALELLPDRNNMIYRDIVSSRALFDFERDYDTLRALDSLKNMVAQAENEMEKLNRFLTIGHIYQDIEQYDSAKAYLMPVFESENDSSNTKLAGMVLHIIALNEGDTLKASQYAQILVEEATSVSNKQLRVSRLNDLFQTFLQEKQDAASLHEKRKAVRTALAVVLPMVVVLAAVVVILMRRRSKKHMAVQEAEAQRQISEASQRLSEASQRHDEEQRELQTKVEQAAQHTREILQQRVTDIYQSNGKDRLQRILEAVDDTYPQTVARLKSEYPELSETERNILLLNFFHFRIKEEADLLGLSENTVAKYRSNLGKTLGKDPISDWI